MGVSARSRPARASGWAASTVAVAVLLSGCGGAGTSAPAGGPAPTTPSSALQSSALPSATPASGAESPLPAEPASDNCPPAGASDTATAAGWLGYLATHRNDISILVDDGYGRSVSQRADQPAPVASAAKVLHLAAYADAIDGGQVTPHQPVAIADWEAWLLPGLDGGAHGSALQAMGIANDGVSAVDPTGTVRLDDIVTAMIQFSDNAAADYLRELLGDNAMIAAATRAGADDIELPSYLGAAIALLLPAQAPDPAASRADQAAARDALAGRYLSDPEFRSQVRALPPPDLETQLGWADNTSTATALALGAMHRQIYAAAGDPTDEGAVNARTHLEWPPVPAGSLGLGAKGGSYPGVLAEAMTLRRVDGSSATAVLLVRRMPAADWTSAATSFAHQELLLGALQDPAVLNRLSCAAGLGSTIPG